jgi:hypothetical protein
VDGERGGKLRTFLLGGLVGSVAGLAAAGRVGVRTARRRTPSVGGLAAFEQAPCFREAVEREAAEGMPDGSATLR